MRFLKYLYSHPIVLCSIKARFKSGDTWYAGKITALNRDGSYAIHYADGDMESNVNRDLIEVIMTYVTCSYCDIRHIL